MPVTSKLLASLFCILNCSACFGQIGVISPADAKEMIEQASPQNGVAVLDTRGGYKDYFAATSPKPTTSTSVHFAALIRACRFNTFPIS